MVKDALATQANLRNDDDNIEGVEIETSEAASPSEVDRPFLVDDIAIAEFTSNDAPFQQHEVRTNKYF